MGNRLVSSIILLLMLASIPLYALGTVVRASPSDWETVNVYWRSSADTSQVYPGSKNVELTVVTKYVGSSQAEDVAACIKLPPGFEISRGFSPCSPPYQPNTSKTYVAVHPGDVVIFRYHVDISKSVAPGNYSLPIEITYVVNGSSYEETLSAYIVVSQYPPLTLKVVDWYWSPTAYPGSAGVTLSIVLQNVGNATVVSAHVVMELPKDVFTPSSARADIGTLGINDRVTISANNIDVSVDAVPGKPYPVTLRINATLRTKDGVTYVGNQTLVIFVYVDKAPPVKLAIVSYGVETPKSVRNEKMSRIYVELQNRDFVTIRSITAEFYLSYGAEFYNGSRYGYVAISGSYGYGSYVSIRSPPIVIESNAYFIYLRLNLTIFGTRNGAEFWVSQVYTLRIPVSKPSLELRIVKAYWSEQVAYPGSSNLALNIVLRNEDVVDLSNAVATLVLPEGMYPRSVSVSGVSIASGSQVAIAFRGIDIINDTSPGTYLAKLVIEGVAKSGSSFYPIKVVLTVPITVSSRVTHLLKVVSAEWSGGRFYTTSAGQSLGIVLRVVKPATVSNVVARVYLPNQLLFYNGNRSEAIVVSGSYGYGATIRIDTGRIYSATNRPCVVPVVVILRGMATIHGANEWFEEVFTIPISIREPVLNLTIVSAKWGAGRCSGNCKGIDVYVTIQSLDVDTVNVMIVNATILKGAVFESGERSEVFTWRGTLNYGEVTTISIGPLTVNSSAISIALRICATLSIGNGRYRACMDSVVDVRTSVVKPLILNSVQTIRNGAYSPILPNQKGVTIRVLLTNIDTASITSMKIEPSLPKGFVLRRIGGSCLSGVASGATCYVDLEVDTLPSLAVGKYLAKISVLAIERVGGSVQIVNESIAFPITVQSPDAYGPKIGLVTWFWGRTQPQTVFGYEKRVPLTIVVSNFGRYSAQSVVVYVKPLNSSVESVVDRALCANTLAPHASCTVTTYFNIGFGEGKAVFSVVVSYENTNFGTLALRNVSFRIALNVEKFAGGSGVYVVSSGWSNSWPAYPGTQNATYTITLVNMWPYTISGINATLYLPKGFSHKGKGYVTAYIAGPVRSLDTFSMSFTVTIDRNVEPGIYRAKLVVSYVVDVGGSQMKWVDVRYVDMEVNSLSNAITLVTVRWLGSAPEPGTYGAMLAIVLRDNYVPSMSGVVLRISLPEGFTCSINNESVATIPPANIGTVPAAPSNVESLQRALAALMSSSASAAQAISVSKGQFVTFVVPLNILVDKPGTYIANATLDFVDQWGNVRLISFRIPIKVMGFTKIIEVEPLNSLSFENGTCVLKLAIRNVGSAPLYDTYVYVVPRSPIAIPKSVVKYLGTLPPKKTEILNITFVYNPFNIVSMGGMAVSYQSLPLVVSFEFRDALGYRHVFNTSISVSVAPFIYIALGSDTNARYREGTLVVSGTVINYGIATAHSVWVYACVNSSCGSTFVGDIDEASQAAFRVELEVPKPVSKALVKVAYLDSYGVMHVKEFVLPVIIENVSATAIAATQRAGFTIAHGVVIAAVAIFLTGVGLAIARYLRRHSAEGA